MSTQSIQDNSVNRVADDRIGNVALSMGRQQAKTLRKFGTCNVRTVKRPEKLENIQAQDEETKY